MLCTGTADTHGFCFSQVDRRRPVILVVITFHTRSGWWDARSVPARDMLVRRDSSLARCPFWFETCSPVIGATTEMLDMQSALQQQKDSTVW